MALSIRFMNSEPYCLFTPSAAVYSTFSSISKDATEPYAYRVMRDSRESYSCVAIVLRIARTRFQKLY
jgi:hypothetical protein